MSKPDKKKDEPDNEKFIMPIPAGVPYSILAQAVNKFGIELVEKEVVLPGSAGDEIVPKAWVLRGDKEGLGKAREFIAKKILESMRRFE
ncbi:MAG: hypothetical protein ABSF36_02845 [Candidatus Methanomethylicaceae archaeon]|jgi:hypothetical protein